MVASTIKKATSSAKKVVNTGVESATKMRKDLWNFCRNEKTIFGCVVGMVVVAYVVLLNQAISLDFFSTVPGKLLGMLVLLVALWLDVRVGVLVAVAIVLSVVYATMNNSVESYSENMEQEFSTDVAPAEEMPVEDSMMEDAPMETSEEDEDEEESFENYAPVNF